jgi:hypothetical protein
LTALCGAASSPFPSSADFNAVNDPSLTHPPDDGIVVVEVERGDDVMQPAGMPAVLRDRLGEGGALALLDLFEEREQTGREDVLNLASERFERRLAEEMAGLRVEFARALHAGLDSVRQEIATSRVELLKWSFLFWVGQLAVVMGMLAVILRFFNP